MNPKHEKDIRHFVAQGDYKSTDEGILIHDSIIGRGVYVHTVNREDEQRDPNIIPAEGILHMLDVVYGATAKDATMYLGLFSGNDTPDSSWTDANWASTYENTSVVEGYVGANRIEFVDAPAAAGKIGNLASKAAYTAVSAGTVTFYGAALLTTQTRGSAGGTLMSATRFANARILSDTDTFDVGYEIELTDS